LYHVIEIPATELCPWLLFTTVDETFALFVQFSNTTSFALPVPTIPEALCVDVTVPETVILVALKYEPAALPTRPPTLSAPAIEPDTVTLAIFILT
jgi:hypothetical protein